MILANKKNDTELMTLVLSIKNYMNEWQIVNVNVIDNSRLSQRSILERLLDQYRRYEGMIYPVSDKKIVMLVRLGLIENYAIMKAEIEQKIPEHCCRVLLRKMSAIGLRQMQIGLMNKDNSVGLQDNLFAHRGERRENVILIADDDPFVRKSMATILTPCGTVFEAKSGDEVVAAYIQHNPDILLLDIHMPEKTGLELIPEIIEYDSDAFILVLSADSMRENVLIALEKGAAGFLTKPPAKQKVQEYLGQCITIR